MHIFLSHFRGWLVYVRKTMRLRCSQSTLYLPLQTSTHRLNMELDLQSLFGLLFTAVLIGWDPATPPLPPHLGSYTRALLASQDRRHLFVTPCLNRFYQPEHLLLPPSNFNQLITKTPVSIENFVNFIDDSQSYWSLKVSLWFLLYFMEGCLWFGNSRVTISVKQRK